MTTEPIPHQLVRVGRLHYMCNSCFKAPTLTDDMGVGKTLTKPARTIGRVTYLNHKTPVASLKLKVLRLANGAVEFRLVFPLASEGWMSEMLADLA